MVAGSLLMAMLIAKLFPDTPIGRLLHLYLVELPLQLGSKIERKHVILALILLVGGQAFILAAPLDLALIYAVDLALYIDALAAVSAAAALGWAKSAWAGLKAKVQQLARTLYGSAMRPRAKQGQRKPIDRYGSNDDDDDTAPMMRAA